MPTIQINSNVNKGEKLDIDLDRLKIWHLNETRTIQNRTNSFKQFLINSYVILFIISLWVFPYMSNLDHNDMEYLDMNAGIFDFVAMVILPVVFYLINEMLERVSFAKLTRLIKNSTPLTIEEYSELYAFCETIAYKANVLCRGFALRYVKSDSFLPCVIERQAIAYVFVPRNFFKLYYDCPDWTSAIITHEFSHVTQEDTRNFINNNPLILNPIIPLVVFLFLSSFNKFAIGIICFYLFILLLFYLAIYPLRRRSERLADISVIFYDNVDNLIAALRAYAVTDKFHKKPEKRINDIYSAIKKSGAVLRKFSTTNANKMPALNN